MLLKNLMADVKARTGVSKAFQFILVISLLTNLFMAGAYATMDRTVRTILVPPEIKQSFWIDGRNIGPEYLEQMGAWVVSSFATISPATVDYQNNTLLKYVHPSVYGDLSIRFKMGANRIKAENLSKVFMPREIRISEKGQSVALIGVQQSWIADKRITGDELKAYLVTFDYDGAKVTIKELRETNAAHPFDPPATQAMLEQEMPTLQPNSAVLAQPTIGGQVDLPVQQAQTSATLPPAPPPPSTAATQAALQAGSAPTQANSR